MWNLKIMMACHVLWKRYINYPCFWYTSSVPNITSIDQSSERSKMHLNYKFKFKWILINTRPNKFIRFIQIFILIGRTASDYEWAIPPGNVNNRVLRWNLILLKLSDNRLRLYFPRFYTKKQKGDDVNCAVSKNAFISS